MRDSVPVVSVDDPSERVAAARRAGRRARMDLSGAERARATERAVAALCSLDELSAPVGAGRISLSWPVRDELDLRAAAPVLRGLGWTTWLPVVVAPSADDPGVMAFREWSDGDEMAVGAFGISEPPDDGRPLLDASGIDVVVAPCVAADETGTRIGFGAGYYDRALADPVSRPLVVVACFDVQVGAEPIPRREWDVPADVVVTDRRVARTGTTQP